MSAGLIRPDAAEAARCGELAARARWLRQRAADIKGGGPGVLTAAQAEAMARRHECALRMAADAALAEAARAADGAILGVSS